MIYRGQVSIDHSITALSLASSLYQTCFLPLLSLTPPMLLLLLLSRAHKELAARQCGEASLPVGLARAPVEAIVQRTRLAGAVEGDQGGKRELSPCQTLGTAARINRYSRFRQSFLFPSVFTRRAGDGYSRGRHPCVSRGCVRLKAMIG